MELKNKKIIFCFPYRGAGGVPLLFLRLGNKLKSLGYRIAIVDYIDGFMAVNNDNAIEFIEYKDNTEININNNSVLVLQTMTPWSIYESLKIHSEANLFFITTIPTNVYPSLPIVRDLISTGGAFAKFIWKTILRDEYKKVKRLVEIGIKTKSLVWLDEDIVCNIKNSLNIKVNDFNILPLFSEDVTHNNYFDTIKENSDKITVGWVGRIADFKVHILNKVIKDLKQYSETNNTKIKFIIIGTGEKENVLLNYQTKNFIIERIEHLEPLRLEKEILKFDVYFAMGTSALDGARLGVPTVRLDYSFSQITKDYAYKFLFDVQGYSLGENIYSNCFKKGKYSINEIIQKVLTNKKDLSILTYEFYLKNHSLEHSAIKFVNYVASSQLIYKDLLEENLLNSKLYSIWKRIK